jgi:uncharacterized protein (DUF433 family)
MVHPRPATCYDIGVLIVARRIAIVPVLDRITQNPAIMGGRPCIRGMRVTVGMIVGQIAAGVSIDALLADYPYLEREDISQALRYAAWRAEEREIILA